MTGPSKTDRRGNPEPDVNSAKALVVGASGFIGGWLLRILRGKNVVTVGTYCSLPTDDLVQLDFSEAQAVRALMARTTPDTVFCPAARPNVEWCESHPRESYMANVIGIQNVAAACADHGAFMVHFSSDYIFDGRHGPYLEEDIPNPINVYGRHKLASEEVVRSLLPQRHVIVRTTVVYGWERQGKNYVIRLVEGLRAGKVARAPMDQVGSPAYGPNLAEAAVELAERNLFGTWNLAGPERMSRYEFSCLAARVFGLDASLIEPVTTAQLQQAAARPLQAGMVIDKAGGALRTPLLGPAEGLRRMRDKESVETRRKDV